MAKNIDREEFFSRMNNQEYFDFADSLVNRLCLLNLEQENDPSKKDSIRPDTYNCEYLFIRNFVTQKMREDFALIANAFLKHEMTNIDKYMELDYADISDYSMLPIAFDECLVLNAMIGAVKQGNSYAKSLLCYLYKLYYKQEYNQMKRFHTLSNLEVFSLAGFDGTFTSDSFMNAVPRILCMAEIMGIEILSDCTMLYLMCDEFVSQSLNRKDSIRESYEALITDKLKESIDATIMHLIENTPQLDKLEAQASNFLAAILVNLGYPVEYMEKLQEDNPTRILVYNKAIALLKLANPNKQYELNEIVLSGKILRCMEILLNANSRRNIFTRCMFNSVLMNSADCIFDPRKLSAANDESVVQPLSSIVKEATKLPENDDTGLFEELARVRTKLHMAESTIRQLKEQSCDLSRRIQQYETVSSRYEEERKELAALKEYVYNMTEKQDITLSEDTETMKDYLSQKIILIIGGHPNWVSKLKSEFPNWKFISPGVSGTVSVALIQNVDKAYFFTDTLSHSNYYKFLQSFRDNNIKFGYLHGVNITNNIAYLYKDLR